MDYQNILNKSYVLTLINIILREEDKKMTLDLIERTELMLLNNSQ